MLAADVLGPAEIERFWRDSALCVRGLFAEWVEPMCAAIEEALDAPGPLAQNPARRDYNAAGHERSASFFIEQGLWSRHAAFRAFAFESPAADVAGRLLRGAQVKLFFDQLFVKEPESPEHRARVRRQRISGYPATRALGTGRGLVAKTHWSTDIHLRARPSIA